MRLLNNSGDLWLPPPELNISEWADEYRRISPEASAEPGRWYTSRAPYQQEMLNAICTNERVVMMTAAQIGKTEMLLNVLGYFIDKEPSPILLLQPTLEMGEAFSKDRLVPMIRDTPCLSAQFDIKAKTSDNNILYKRFERGGAITIAGANSPASLASRPIRILLCDEVDRYPVSAGTEGDPLSLAMKRTQNFWNRRIVWVSTPTLLGVSRIEKAYNASSMEEWCVPCPTCGEYQPYSWEQITFKDLPEPIMTCAKCGAKHNEVEWKAGQERGKWIAGNPDEKKSRGFHVNAFASAWVTWKSLIEQYTEAFRNGEEELKVWWNTVLGLPFENTSGAIEAEALESHREEYPAELPDGVLVLTCGVDTQDDRLECEVVGWGIGHESWGIEYRVFYGDPGLKEVWQALDDFLSKTWSYGNGDKLGLGCVCIDSAGQVALGLVDERVDLLQSLQVPHGRAVEQAENHVHIVGEAHAALLLVADEVDHHVRLVVAHGDGYVALVYDAKGHSGVGRAAAYLLHVGNAQDDEHPAVVVFIAGPFVGIADV